MKLFEPRPGKCRHCLWVCDHSNRCPNDPKPYDCDLKMDTDVGWMGRLVLRSDIEKLKEELEQYGELD